MLISQRFERRVEHRLALTASSPARSSASATNARISSARGLGRNAAAGHVEERVAVELADRRAVGAFDVVGEDFELGLGVDRRRAREQQALEATARASVFCASRATSTRPRKLPVAGAPVRPRARPGGWSPPARRASTRVTNSRVASPPRDEPRPPNSAWAPLASRTIRRRAACRSPPAMTANSSGCAPSPTVGRDAVKLGPDAVEDQCSLRRVSPGGERDLLAQAERRGRERLQRREVGVAPVLVDDVGWASVVLERRAWSAPPVETWTIWTQPGGA